jgi:hypothetical protein
MRAAPEEQWMPLFDGKTLDGWTPKITKHECGVNFGDTFRVKDGCIVVSYDQYNGKFDGQFGHLFYKDKFSHYRFRMEYRFTGEQCPGGPTWGFRNCGILFHGQDPKTMGKDQNFPVSIETQLLGSFDSKPRTTGNVCTPGTNIVLNGKLHTPHCFNSKLQCPKWGDWVKAEIEVRGSGKVKQFINGELALEYEQPQYDPNDADGKKLIPKSGELLISEGTICIQSESHPCEYRKIEILKLEK